MLCSSGLLIFFNPEEGALGRESKAAALADTIATPSSGSVAWLCTEVLTTRLFELMQPFLFVFALTAYSLSFYQHTDTCCKYLYCV